jgi:hypothetical protein
MAYFMLSGDYKRKDAFNCKSIHGPRRADKANKWGYGYRNKKRR